MSIKRVSNTPEQRGTIMAKQQKIRINVNVTEEQKADILRLANNMQMNLTEYILNQCLNPVKPDYEENRVTLESLRQQIRLQQDIIDQATRDIEMWQQNYNAAFNMAQMGMWHSLPFWKKLFTKVKELPNK